MDFIKAQLNRIQEQIGSLNASQKMLTGALVAIMVMTLLWWGRYAGEAEMSPLLDQSFSADDITQVTTRLASKGIKYQVAGDKVMVPTDRKFEALADLSYSRLLPRDIKTGFDEIVKQMSPFAPASTTEKMWNKATEMTLAQIIRNFPNVNNAMVLIDPTRARQIGGSIEPTATVNITMRDGIKPGKQLVNAAADVVAGAEAGLSRSKVAVIVDGVSYPVQDRDNEFSNAAGGGGDAIEQIQQHEKYYSEKILKQLEFIQGVMVSVTVDLNRKYVEKKEHTIDAKNTITKEKQITTDNEESNSSTAAIQDPGVTSNTGLSLPGGGGAGTTTSHEHNEVVQEILPSTADTITRSPGGDAAVVAASVGVPRSYFVSIYKNANPNAKDPEDKLLQPLVDAELLKVKRYVKGCTGIKDDGAVNVDMYVDVVPMMATAPETSSATSMIPMLGSHTKEIGVVALAVVSLFMVMMMVRKGSPSPVVSVALEPIEPPQLHSGEEVAGEAGEGSSTLDGMELDEDAIRANQMIDQVSTMVKENPDAAANLVKRWLNRA